MILEATEIMTILPHRYPMLLVDRILELEPMKSAVGIKNVTINEPFFAGHFPGTPVMPGVLICECMGQVAGVAMLYSKEYRNRIPMFTGMDHVRFRSAVLPGDTLRVEAKVTKVRGQVGRVECQAFVGDVLKAEGEFMFYLQERQEEQKTEEK